MVARGIEDGCVDMVRVRKLFSFLSAYFVIPMRGMLLLLL